MLTLKKKKTYDSNKKKERKKKKSKVDLRCDLHVFSSRKKIMLSHYMPHQIIQHFYLKHFINISESERDIINEMIIKLRNKIKKKNYIKRLYL